MALFSIIVPCYNASKYVDKLFNMLSSKDYTNYEVILVDDCSKDGTYDILSAKCQNYDNFKAFQTPQNGGPGPARNLGLSKAEGQYVLFCDSDDFFDISYLPQIDEFLCKKNDVDIIVSPHLVVRGQKTTVSDAYTKYGDGERITAEDVVTGYGGPVAKVYRKAIITENGIEFPARMTGEDACFVANYSVHVKNAYKMSFPYYSYIMNDASITHSHRADWRIPTTFEILLPVYQQHFPNVVLGQFIEGHLLTKAKLMTDAKCKNSEIRKWFTEENKRYPNWYEYAENLDGSIYRRMVYFAMKKSSPVLIKLIMLIRRILY